MACSLVFSSCFSFGDGPESGYSFFHNREGKCDLFVIVVVDVFVDKEVKLGIVDPGSGFLWVSIKGGWLS